MTKQTALVTGGAGLIGSHIVDAGAGRRLGGPHPRQPGAADAPPGQAAVGARRRPSSSRATCATAAIGSAPSTASTSSSTRRPTAATCPRSPSSCTSTPYGTALMLETIRDREPAGAEGRHRLLPGGLQRGRLPCPSTATSTAPAAPIDQLARGDFDDALPRLRRGRRRRLPTDEAAPMGGENVYAITKADQERLVLAWGRATGIPVGRPALLLHLRSAPVGLQPLHRRDRHLLHPPAQRPAAGGLRGRPPIARPRLRRGRGPRQPARRRRSPRRRPGLQRRHRPGGRDRRPGAPARRRASASRLEPAAAGRVPPRRDARPDLRHRPELARPRLAPEIDLATGIDRYLDWIGSQGNVKDYFSAAERTLRRRQIVKRAGQAAAAAVTAMIATEARPTAAVIIPALERRGGDRRPGRRGLGGGRPARSGGDDRRGLRRRQRQHRRHRRPGRGRRGHRRRRTAARLRPGLPDRDGSGAAGRSARLHGRRPQRGPGRAAAAPGAVARRRAPTSSSGRASPAPNRARSRPSSVSATAVATALLRLLYGVRVTDIAPFRVIRRQHLLDLGMSEMTYGWSIEMIARAAQRGLRVVEVPVTCRRRAGGVSKVSGNLRASAAPATGCCGPSPPSASAANARARCRHDDAAHCAPDDRRPRTDPGQTKTRFGAAIGMEAAATLYRAFLTDLAGRFGPRPGSISAGLTAPRPATFGRCWLS